MEERQSLQIQAMRDKQEEERKLLCRDLSHVESITTPEKAKSQEAEHKTYPDDNLEIISDDDRDFERQDQGLGKSNKGKSYER